MEWKYFLALGSTVVLLTACSQNSNYNGTNSSSSSSPLSTSSSLISDAMDPSQITAPQVGLSDAEWNQSRGTVSDGQDTNSQNPPTRILTKDATSLIIYFSRSGSTELLASKVQAGTKADVIELVADETYSSDYGETVQRANREREEEGNPRLKVDIPDLSQYDTIYLGYPIWGMTLAEPMASFIEKYGDQLAGKTLAPFSTNGSYGVGSSVTRIQSILDSKGVTVRITQPYTIEGNKVDQADSILSTWLDAIAEN